MRATKKVTIYVSPDLFPKVCSLLVCNTQPISGRHGLNSKAKTKMFLAAIEYGLDAKNNLSFGLIIVVVYKYQNKNNNNNNNSSNTSGVDPTFFFSEGGTPLMNGVTYG